MQPTGQPVAWLFINTNRPSDATTLDSLKKIRSHAAKEVQVRSRALKSRKVDSGRNRSLKRLEQNTHDDRGDMPTCLAISASEGPGPSTPVLTSTKSMSLSGAHQVTSLSCIAPARCSTAVRSFTDQEHFLLDHCASIPFS